MMFSFVILQLEERFMSSKTNKIVAIINDPEKYQTLKAPLSTFFKEVNEL